MATEVVQTNLTVAEAGDDPIAIAVNLTVLDAESGSGPGPGPSGGRRRPVIVACGE